MIKIMVALILFAWFSPAFAWDDNECIKIIVRGDHSIILPCDNHDYDWVSEQDIIELQPILKEIEKEFRERHKQTKSIIIEKKNRAISF